MAAAPQPKSSRYGNTQISKGRTQVSPVPETPIIIQDEENPIPDKYEGDINFNKVVYSLKEFRDKIDLGFNELTSNTPNVNTQQFFDLYNELFFDIPKEGENSHTTIVQTSLDYLDNYISPLQSIIDSKDVEIESLNQQLLTIQGELSTLQIAAQEEEAQEAQDEINTQIALAEYQALYGTDFTNNPQMKYGKLKTTLEIMDSEGVLRKSLSKNFNDLSQAKEKEDGDISTKSYNQWNAAIDKRAEGKVKDDLRDMINRVRLNISSGVGAIPGEGPQL
jgi:hypothetical protein